MLGALAVLVLAALTWSALFLAPPQWHLRFDMNNAPAWFAALVSSFSIAALYLLNRQSNSRAMHDAEERLRGRPQSHGEIAKRQISLQMEAKVFKDATHRIVDDGEDIMLICREVPAKGEKTYSTDSIREQIEEIQKSEVRPRIRWTVFVTNENEFVAFQSFDSFLAFVLNEKAGPYRKALNQRDSGVFRKTFEKLDTEEAHTTYDPSVLESELDPSVIIFGLNRHKIDQKATREDMIRFMDEQQTEEAMVVFKGRPVGIVRRSDLMNSIVSAML